MCRLTIAPIRNFRHKAESCCFRWRIPPCIINRKATCLIIASSWSPAHQRGIGREAALAYARYGAEVILLGRNADKLQQVEQTINQLNKCPAHTLVFDLAEATPERCQQLAHQLAQQFTHLDGVLYNAGILGEIVPLEELVDALRQRPARQSVSITGRGCHRSLLEMADTVTEMRPVKHAFDACIQAQQGIDW
ncbi:SDR family NAD(P)-dependent oxidoreductase [Pantoea sp. Eser]|nr:SDR family NAD(P)-dependent oxidoreductase [Pantoea sp. Eser]